MTLIRMGSLIPVNVLFTLLLNLLNTYNCQISPLTFTMLTPTNNIDRSQKPPRMDGLHQKNLEKKWKRSKVIQRKIILIYMFVQQGG